MAEGLWLGVVAEAQLETEEPVFGRRKWLGPSAVAYWAPEAMPSDHFVLKDSTIKSVFVHLDNTAIDRIGVDRNGLNTWSGHMLRDGRPAFAALQDEVHTLVNFPALAGPSRLLSAGQHIAQRFLQSAQLLPVEHGADDEFSDFDLRQMRHVRDLLLTDVRNPPSIAQLARASGMNSRKLTEQFRAMFGRRHLPISSNIAWNWR